MAVCLGVDEEALWDLALADREHRLRDRLNGVPTAAKGVPVRSRPSLPRGDAPSPAGIDAFTGLVDRIRGSLPTGRARREFVESLEALIEILKSTT
jgi:hypothetical protein